MAANPIYERQLRLWLCFVSMLLKMFTINNICCCIMLKYIYICICIDMSIGMATKYGLKPLWPITVRRKENLNDQKEMRICTRQYTD